MPSSKPAIALVHGWGMNARVFDALAARLAADFDVHALDLPGHGGRPEGAYPGLESWALDVLDRLPPRCTLLGWSLGGQVAMRVALDHPERIERLVLLATTPRFVASDDWPHGIALDDLQAFGADLLRDPRATLLRFLSLQTRGAADPRRLLARLRTVVAEAPEVDRRSLETGLDLLAGTDLRVDARRIAAPTLILHGALDRLTPVGAGTWLASTLPAAREVVYARAAHAPHLSHVDEVAADIGQFVHA